MTKRASFAILHYFLDALLRCVLTIILSLSLLCWFEFQTYAKSTPLIDQKLTKGRSQYVPKPDYLFKLVEALWLNSQYKDYSSSTRGVHEKDEVTKEIASYGVLALSSDDLYALDAEVRKILDPVFEKHFPQLMDKYNLVFVDTDEFNASIFKGESKHTIPTIIIRYGLLKELDTEEELLAALFHETAHRLHAHFEKDPWYTRILNGMAEEDIGDIFATRMLVEAKRNPQGVSILFEKIIKKGGRPKNSGQHYEKAGLSSHPPGEVRLSRVNAHIEKLADRSDFPPLNPFQGALLKAHKLQTRQDHAGMRFITASAQSLGDALSVITYSEFWKKSSSGKWSSYLTEHYLKPSSIKFLEDEFQLLLSRVVPENLKAWGVTKSWDPVALGFQKAWEDLPIRLRADPQYIDLFYREENWLKSMADRLGGEFRSIDAKHIQNLAQMKKVQSAEDLMSWALEFKKSYPIPTNKDRYEWLKSQFQVPTYSLAKDPSLFESAFDHYVELAPMLKSWADQALAEGALQSPTSKAGQLLTSIIDYRDVLLANLIGWVSDQEMRYVLTHYQTEYYRLKAFASDSLTKHRHHAFFSKWDEKIKKLPFSAYAKLAFFPSIAIDDFLWLWDGKNKSIHGDPIFPSAMEFLSNPELVDPSFQRFNDGLSYLLSLQPGQKPVHFKFERKIGSGSIASFPLQFEFVKEWVLQTVEKFQLTTQDALHLLNTDYYWENTNKEREKNFRENVKSWIDIAFAVDTVFRLKLFKKKDRSEIYQETDEALDSLFSKDNFYSRPEYRLDPQYAQALQLQIYSNLKKNLTLPLAIEEEIALWEKFAKRGVSAFTDEWAASLIDRIFSDSTPLDVRTERLKKMYFTNLVWDLTLRSQMAFEIFKPENNAQVLALREEITNPATSWTRFKQKRKNRIDDLLRVVLREFPEDSQERLQVIDRIATNIRANRDETTYMMHVIGHEARDLKDLSLTKKQGFGIRFYVQIFSELQNADLNQRLRLLDFFLGKTNEIPELLDQGWTQNASYHEELKKKFPLLIEIAQNIGKYGPYRIRRSFQALNVEAKTALLDPLFIGKEGILATQSGRDWVINTLVPKNATWKKMAIDLTEGFVEALSKFGQSHLKTMFLSYLVASNVESSRGQFTEIFPKTEKKDSPAEESEGKVLKSLFSANAALTKIGQRVHSSNVLRPAVNKSIESLKENAATVLREDQFHWIEDASHCDQAWRKVRLLDEKGNASVKIVMDAIIDGMDCVLYLIKPNAFRRGDVFFQMIEYAIQYAIDRGNTELKLIQPMVRRARANFHQETDLTLEKAGAEKMRAAYSPGDKSYGQGYQFVSLEFLEVTDKLFHTHLATAVRKIHTKRFSELSDDEKVSFTQAVTEKEAEIHASTKNTSYIEMDRHEGNYLLVTDEVFKKELGLSGQKVILVIDLAQTAKIASLTRDSILDSLAALTAYQIGMLSLNTSTATLSKALNKGIMLENDDLTAALEQTLPKVQELSGGAALSRVLAYIEADGFKVKDETWDYLSALSTLNTWNRYDPNNAFVQHLQQSVISRCQALSSH